MEISVTLKDESKCSIKHHGKKAYEGVEIFLNSTLDAVKLSGGGRLPVSD
jgi:hypothetical protein